MIRCKCGKKTDRGNYCYACAKAAYRKKNPIKASYQALKDGAKRRGKYFNLTFEQYAQFVIETEYYKKKGIRSTSLHIDRINENKGYTIDNIQVLSNSENIRKYLKFRERDQDGRVKFEVITDKPMIVECAPF